MPRRIVQLTDCHLFADQSKALRDVVTWPRFTEVLNNLRQRVSEVDLIVLTGDTAHDEDLTTYQAVRKEFADLVGQVRIIPGNHDNRTYLREMFPQTTDGPEDRVTFQLHWDDWQIIGLDSQQPGELPGLLGASQLDWLDRTLKNTQHLRTLLFLHHPPVEVQSPWLDKIGLLDAAELHTVLRVHPQVTLIGCGHVHQQLAASFGSATVMTTPAVGPPFRPRTEQLEIDTNPASYRLWELFPDGRWSTQVMY